MKMKRKVIDTGQGIGQEKVPDPPPMFSEETLTDDQKAVLDKQFQQESDLFNNDYVDNDYVDVGSELGQQLAVRLDEMEALRQNLADLREWVSQVMSLLGVETLDDAWEEILYLHGGGERELFRHVKRGPYPAWRGRAHEHLHLADAAVDFIAAALPSSSGDEPMRVSVPRALDLLSDEGGKAAVFEIEGIRYEVERTGGWYRVWKEEK